MSSGLGLEYGFGVSLHLPFLSDTSIDSPNQVLWARRGQCRAPFAVSPPGRSCICWTTAGVRPCIALDSGWIWDLYEEVTAVWLLGPCVAGFIFVVNLSM
jgi:hypothetical protein